MSGHAVVNEWSMSGQWVSEWSLSGRSISSSGHGVEWSLSGPPVVSEWSVSQLVRQSVGQLVRLRTVALE